MKYGGGGFESHLPQPPRTSFVAPGLSGLEGHVAQNPPSCVWFEHAECWGTTMPVTRDSPSIQGMSLAQTPPGLPLTRRLPGRGSLVGGSRRGSPLPAKVRPGGAPLPPRAGRPWSMFRPHRWNRPVPGGHRRYVVPQVAGAILGEQIRVKSADKTRMAGGRHEG
jgi:hypothetical protein